MSRARYLPPLLALLSLLLALVGQWRLARFAQGMREWPLLQQALAAFVVAGAALLWGRLLVMRQADALAGGPAAAATAARGRLKAALRPRRGPSDALLASASGLLVFGALLVWLARLPEPPPPGTLLWPWMVAWIVAILLVSVPWLKRPRRADRSALREWTRARAAPLGAIAAITLLGALLRLPNLDAIPYTVNGDEGSIALEIRALLAGQQRTPFSVIWGPHSVLAAYILGGFQLVLGPGIGSLRLLGALLGTLAIPTLGALAWQVAGRRVAVAAALLLATLPFHIHYSRVMLMVVWDSWSFTTTFALLFLGLRRPALRWPFVLAGLVGGFGQYAYTGSRLLPVLVVGFLAAVALFDRRRLRAALPGLALFALVFTVVAGPHYLYALRFPHLVNYRIASEGIFQSGWLAQEAVIRGESPLLVLFDQFRRALFGFAFFPDRSGGWAAGRPMAEPIVALGLFLGLAATLPRWRDWRYALAQGWFWAAVITAGVLTLNPPSSTRFVSTPPVIALLAALGWAAVARALAKSAAPRYARPVASALFALVIGAAAVQGLATSQRTLAESGFGGPGTYAATRIAREIPHGATLVLLGDLTLAPTLSTFDYLLGEPPYALEEPLGAEAPTELPPGPLLFVVAPSRYADLETLIATFPGHEPQPQYHPRGALLYYEMLVERP